MPDIIQEACEAFCLWKMTEFIQHGITSFSDDELKEFVLAYIGA